MNVEWLIVKSTRYYCNQMWVCRLWIFKMAEQDNLEQIDLVNPSAFSFKYNMKSPYAIKFDLCFIGIHWLLFTSTEAENSLG